MTDTTTDRAAWTDGDPTPLRWGLNDVMWGDDDTVTVLLSGPAGEPYWLELGPERAAVLRADLAGPEGVEEIADAVLPAPADRTAVLAEAAARYEEILANANTGQDPRYWTAVRDITLGLRRMAAEEQPATKAQQDEDPARIDRLRPEFTEHSSIDAIDAQLRRARAQERRWHIRTEWLIGLRAGRVAQKGRGEWPTR